jgi:YHS domain-containing protein
MKYLNERMQAIVMIVCDKHAPTLLEKVQQCQEGNWFVMPHAATCRTGYWPNVSESHTCQGCAIMGFAETQAMTRTLEEFAAFNDDGSLCPDCVAYEWDITPSHVAATAHDLVCGRAVACSNSVSQNHDGELFFFCSVGCRDEFNKSPEKFVGRKS